MPAVQLSPVSSSVNSPKPVVSNATEIETLESIEVAIKNAQNQQAEIAKQIAELRHKRDTLIANRELAKKQNNQSSQSPHNESQPKTIQATSNPKPVTKIVTASAKTSLPKEKQIRSDYIVYAILDGRAWVTSIANKVNYTYTKGDTLPDGTKVTGLSMSDTRLEVMTTGGSIVADTKSQVSVKGAN